MAIQSAYKKMSADREGYCSKCGVILQVGIDRYYHRFAKNIACENCASAAKASSNITTRLGAPDKVHDSNLAIEIRKLSSQMQTMQNELKTLIADMDDYIVDCFDAITAHMDIELPMRGEQQASTEPEEEKPEFSAEKVIEALLTDLSGYDGRHLLDERDAVPHLKIQKQDKVISIEPLANWSVSWSLLHRVKFLANKLYPGHLYKLRSDHTCEWAELR